MVRLIVVSLLLPGCNGLQEEEMEEEEEEEEMAEEEEEEMVEEVVIQDPAPLLGHER